MYEANHTELTKSQSQVKCNLNYYKFWHQSTINYSCWLQNVKKMLFINYIELYHDDSPRYRNESPHECSIFFLVWTRRAKILKWNLKLQMVKTWKTFYILKKRHFIALYKCVHCTSRPFLAFLLLTSAGCVFICTLTLRNECCVSCVFFCASLTLLCLPLLSLQHLLL